MPKKTTRTGDIVPVIYKRHTKVRGNRVTTRFKAAFTDLAREARRLQRELAIAKDERCELHTLLVSYGHGEEADQKLKSLALIRR